MLASLRRFVPGNLLLVIAGTGVLVLGIDTVQGAPGSSSAGGVPGQVEALIAHLDVSLAALNATVESSAASLEAAVQTSAEATRPNLGPRTAADLVMVRTSGSPCATAGGQGLLFDQRLMGNGDADTFAIPPGKVLVVTGVAWRSVGNVDPIASMTIRLEPPGTLLTAYFDTQPVLAGGYGGASGDIPSFTVPPGVDICMLGSGNGGPSGNLYGYLADDGS